MGYPRPSLTPAEKRSAQEFWAARGVSSDRFVCCFFGAISPTFELGTIVAAASALRQQEEDGIQFVICGEGGQLQQYRDQMRGLSNILFPGWVNAAQISALMELSQVGLAPYSVSATSMSLPNKPFEYMAGGLPVLSSLRGELEQILAENDCGLTYPAASVDGFLDALRSLRDDPARRRRMGANARRLYEQSFSADVIYTRMIDYLEELVVLEAGKER